MRNNENHVWWIKSDLDNMPTTSLPGLLPKFTTSTGGLLPSGQKTEFYGITWTSKSEQPFELPTGGVAVMHEGENVIYFARKEQCLALSKALRKFKPAIKDGKIYRVLPGQEPLLIHPADGVLPEKLNKTREQVNTNMRRISDNPSPNTVKWTTKTVYGGITE